MIIRLGVTRVNERHFINVFSKVRKDRRDPFATLTLRREFERGLHQVSDGILKKAGGILELRGELFDAFAIPFFKFG